ncbi:MAG: hypothetical protein OEX08_00375 [Candidatus Nomurabacteria bacterium]|nr:hypothetical protein [Candidatus Nomurabacteria bacterium]
MYLPFVLFAKLRNSPESDTNFMHFFAKEKHNTTLTKDSSAVILSIVFPYSFAQAVTRAIKEYFYYKTKNPLRKAQGIKGSKCPRV